MLGGTAEVSNTGDNFFLLFIQIYSPFPFYYLASEKELTLHSQKFDQDKYVCRNLTKTNGRAGGDR